MRKSITYLFILMLGILMNGCVTRTISHEPYHRGSTPDSQRYGAKDPNSKVIETKRIWFWQDEFHNP